jgi:hypothetical protein
MMTTLFRSRLGFSFGIAASLAFALGGVAPVRAQRPAYSGDPGTQTALPVIVADFNRDGIPDALVVSTTSPTATLAFGSVPYGTFSGTAKAVTFPAGCTSLPQGSVVVGDFNNDGFPDILFFCNTAGVMLGNGDGTFAAAVSLTGYSGGSPVLGDFNKDGKLDIAVLATFGDSTQLQRIQFFAGNGDGTFNEAVNSNLVEDTFSSPVVADVNGDGYPDIVMIDQPLTDATIAVFGNNKDGTFGAAYQGYQFTANATANFTADNPSSLLSGNFFGTGLSDFAVGSTGLNPGLIVIQNQSTATTYSFGDPTTISYPALTGAMAGSFTGSGFTDIAVANGTSIAVLANDGTGSFAATYPTLTLASTSALFGVADANGDGYSDIFTAVQPATGNMQLGVSLTTGSATATSQPISLAVGTKNVSATWPGNVSLSGATASGQQTVLGAASVTMLASSLNPSTAGTAVTFSVAVTPFLPNDAVPTGAVVLTDGTTMLASGTLEGGTFSYTTSALTQATHTITAAYAGDGYFAPSNVVLSQVVNHAPAVPSNLLLATPNAVVYGMALTASMLNASAVDATGAPIPGTFAYSPALGTVLDAGPQTITVTFTPTDLQSYLPATASVTVTIAQATPSLTWATPASIVFGTPLSAAQLDASAAGVNAAALPGVFTYTPALGTVLSAGTQTLTVSFAPTNSRDYMAASASVQLVVTSSVAATVTAPPTAPPGTQPEVTVTLTQPYPVALTGTLTIDFARSGGPQLVDPALQFAAGGTTYTFPIPANTTTIPPVLLQAGTIAGTITVPLTLTAGEVNVTPANLAPATIVVPPSAPIITSMTLTRNATQLTVVMHGFSNTREVATAQFHFTAATGAQLGTTDLTLPADLIFNTNWFDTTESDAYGSTFTYTQVFNLSDSATTVGSVSATLTNGVGISNSVSAQ